MTDPKTPEATGAFINPAKTALEPTIGRIVHYRLSELDVGEIRRRRVSRNDIADGIERGVWPMGAQAHVGNPVNVGDVVPLVVIRPWHHPGMYEQGASVLNGQALLDGADSLWVMSVKEGSEPGTWCWPPRS